LREVLGTRANLAAKVKGNNSRLCCKNAGRNTMDVKFSSPHIVMSKYSYYRYPKKRPCMM